MTILPLYFMIKILILCCLLCEKLLLALVLYEKDLDILCCLLCEKLLEPLVFFLLVSQSCILFLFQRDTQEGVLISDLYQGKQLALQGKDSLTHNDAKKIKLH
jgi:hypothetical protein